MLPDQVFREKRIVLSSLRTQSDSDQINPIMLDNLPGIFREIQLLLRARQPGPNSYLSSHLPLSPRVLARESGTK